QRPRLRRGRSIGAAVHPILVAPSGPDHPGQDGTHASRSGRLLMSLRKALGWSGFSAGIKIALGFFSAKVSAIYLGPAGMVLVGQINSFMQVTAGAIGNGANTAVVNLTAERLNTPEALRRLWSSAMQMVLIVAGIVAAAVFVGARPLSAWLFFDRGYWP